MSNFKILSNFNFDTVYTQSDFTFNFFTVGIPNADISRVAGNLPQWQMVARKLGFGEQEIGYIETNSGAPEDQRKAFLKKWIGKNGISATYYKLCTALLQLDEYGAAEKIREIPK